MTRAGNPVGALSGVELEHLTAYLEAVGRSEDLYRMTGALAPLAAPEAAPELIRAFDDISSWWPCERKLR